MAPFFDESLCASLTSAEQLCCSYAVAQQGAERRASVREHTRDNEGDHEVHKEK